LLLITPPYSTSHAPRLQVCCSREEVLDNCGKPQCTRVWCQTCLENLGEWDKALEDDDWVCPECTAVDRNHAAAASGDDCVAGSIEKQKTAAEAVQPMVE
jgi:hypothetical protein